VVLITDYKTTYAVYTYNCDTIKWGRAFGQDWASIGFNINSQSSLGLYDGVSFFNNPFSGSAAVTDVDCKNSVRGSRSSNFVYKVGEIGPGNIVVSCEITK